MKIVQISQGARGVIGLSDDGDLYVLRNVYKYTPKTEEEIKLEQEMIDSGSIGYFADPIRHDLIGEEWFKIEIVK
jgi:hypothetical protein